MKKYIVALSLLFTSTIFSQSLTDKLIIGKINEYRIENNLKKLKFSNVAYKAAKHHNNYLINHLEDGLTHDEKGETPTPWHRLIKYMKKSNGKFVWSVENLYCVSVNPDTDLNAKNVAEWTAYQTIDSWKNSPGHDYNMLFDEITDIGIHTIITDDNELIVTYVGYTYY